MSARETRLSWGGNSIVGSQCNYCIHRIPGNPQTCPAFDNGPIPPEIESNLFDHRKPHPAEAMPVRFTPRPDVDLSQLRRLVSALDAIG